MKKKIEMVKFSTNKLQLVQHTLCQGSLGLCDNRNELIRLTGIKISFNLQEMY